MSLISAIRQDKFVVTGASRKRPGKNMILFLTVDTAIHQLQLEFSRRYPFLRLEFFKPLKKELTAENEVSPVTLLKSAGLSKEGELVIEDSMTVKQLENIFEQKFGLYVHVSRRSGLLWLRTSLTNSWTLEKQNEQGREICLTVNPYQGKAVGK
jgi:hypothetical protein